MSRNFSAIATSLPAAIAVSVVALVANDDTFIARNPGLDSYLGRPIAARYRFRCAAESLRPGRRYMAAE